MVTGTGERSISLDVANVGRLPVTIQGVGIVIDIPKERRTGGLLVAAFESNTEPGFIPFGINRGAAQGPQLPCRVLDGDSETWYFSPQPIALTMVENNALSVVRVYATLATGKRVISSGRKGGRINVAALVN